MKGDLRLNGGKRTENNQNYIKPCQHRLLLIFHKHLVHFQIKRSPGSLKLSFNVVQFFSQTNFSLLCHFLFKQ